MGTLHSYWQIMASAAEQFGGRIRVRSCGILIEGNSILLVNQKGLNDEPNWWSPPGGGVDYGETIEEALIREFREETGLKIEVGSLIETSEYIKAPFHAIELFYAVKQTGGELTIGRDPELDIQIIQDVKLVTFNNILLLSNQQIHPVLHQIVKEQV